MKDRSRPRSTYRGLAMYLSHFDRPSPSPSPGAGAAASFSSAGAAAAASSSSSSSAASSAAAPVASSGPAPAASNAPASGDSSAPAVLTAAQRARMEAHGDLEALLRSRFCPRQWEILDPSSEATFTVLSYNLLSNSLAQVDRKYQGSTLLPDPRRWAERSVLLLDEIAAVSADIVCLQELDEPDHDGDFGTSMVALGYASVFKKRRNDLDHGMAIFYRTARVSLVRDCPVRCPDLKYITGVENAAVMLVLEVDTGSSQQPVCVATTHVVNGDDEGLRKLGQLMSMMAGAEIQLRRDPEMPFIIGGDFNTLPASELCKFVKTGVTTVPWWYEDDVLREFKTETWTVRELVDPSAFATKAKELRALVKALRNDLVDREVSHSVHTASVYSLRNIVDQIFHGQIGGSPALKVVSRLELPESLAQLKYGLPAAHLGSDHFALGAKFCFINEVDEVDEADHEEEEWEEEDWL